MLENTVRAESSRVERREERKKSEWRKAFLAANLLMAHINDGLVLMRNSFVVSRTT
jgi:hypothetical protein